MSNVTNLLLSVGVEDSGNEKRAEVNTFFDQLDTHSLVGMNDPALPRGWYGGSKMLEADLFIGAFNFLDLKAFHKHLRSIEWKEPEAVQLIVMEQEDFVFRLINVFPEAFEQAQRELERHYTSHGYVWPPDDFAAQQLIQSSEGSSNT